MTLDEVAFILTAVEEIVANVAEWKKDYSYDPKTNEFRHFAEINRKSQIDNWFEMG